jgi:DNA-binding transcriptional regulator YiaG
MHNRLSFHRFPFLKGLYSKTEKKKQAETCTRVFFVVAKKQTITQEFFMSLELVNNWKTFFGVDTDEMLCSTLNISMSALQKWKHSRGEPSPAMLRNIEFRKQMHEQKTRKTKDKKNV